MAGRIQSSQLFTRTKRVWLVQVEITQGVVYYTVMRFVRPEKKIVRDGGGTAAYAVYTLYAMYTASPAYTACATYTASEQMGYYAHTYYTYCYGLYEDLVW